MTIFDLHTAVLNEYRTRRLVLQAWERLEKCAHERPGGAEVSQGSQRMDG
jgi:hypothetical protein